MFTNRRDFLKKAAIALVAIPVALPQLARAQSLNGPIRFKGKTMTAVTAVAATTDDVSIRPFSVSTTEDELRDLRTRIAAARLPDQELVGDASQGVQLATIQTLMSYWGAEYDLRRIETRLNALPQFTTQIDGVDIHFIHVRSKHDDALPLIVTHGWPGSVVEMLEVLDPLTDPTAHGGSAEDAFHVVVPSMPGYGFSSKPTTTGWGAGHIAGTWAELMNRVGYTAYVAQGGDQGAIVTHAMASLAPEGLLGIHLNLLPTVPADVAAEIFGGGPAPAGISDQERAALGAFTTVIRRGYLVEQNEHPQTIGYSLTDSPVGLAAWMLDHDPDSYQKISQAFVDGQPVGGLTRERIVDNMTLYWLTSSATSAARLYWEGARATCHGCCGRAGATARHLASGLHGVPGRARAAPAQLAREALPQPHLLQAGRQGRALRRVGRARAIQSGSARRVPIAPLAPIAALSFIHWFKSKWETLKRCTNSRGRELRLSRVQWLRRWPSQVHSWRRLRKRSPWPALGNWRQTHCQRSRAGAAWRARVSENVGEHRLRGVDSEHEFWTRLHVTVWRLAQVFQKRTFCAESLGPHRRSAYRFLADAPVSRFVITAQRNGRCIHSFGHCRIRRATWLLPRKASASGPARRGVRN